jgi:type IV fimbrial biogenesis protein FimT
LERNRQQLLGTPQGRNVLSALHRQSGVNLIELMIGLAVLAILILVSLPSYTVWIQNTQIRTAAEGILAGLDLARAEAIRRNANVELEMGAGSTWTVRVTSDGQVIQKREEEGSGSAVVSVRPAGATKVTFNGFGSVTFNLDGTPSITEIKVDSDKIAAADSRELCVMVSGGGVVRLCDPQVALPDPRACTPAVPAGCL